MTVGGMLISSMVATAASAGVAAYSAVKQGEAAEAEANFNASVVQRNALQEKLVTERNMGAAEANKKELAYGASRKLESVQQQGKFDRASLTASLAGRGLSMGGTSQDLLLSSLYQTELQGAEAIYGSSAEGLSLERQKDTFSLQGKNALLTANAQAAGLRTAGRNAKSAGYLGAAGHVFSGASSVFSTGSDYLALD